MSLLSSYIFCLVAIMLHNCIKCGAMDVLERHRLRDQVKEMFNHGFNSYMRHAYPADELMPLSCKGRFRGVEENRGDIDEAMGNFSLTLVDSIDTLVILNQLDDFENSVRLIIQNVRVDNDFIVSVFETNIRMLGGLISNHILAKLLQESKPPMFSWYNNELLAMAKELGLRLLPSFNSTTGIPHPRINLRSGMQQLPKTSETCTACAGTMLLEFAALSRLTGEPVFETKARRAMDYLWLQRHRSSDLVGTIINVDSGDWVRRDSGVGAGIDSYYEYCLKAYILLGDDTYLDRFNKHYNAVMKYISQGPMLVDVHMHRPNTNSKNFMDALLAFWPGLQVLKGDIKPAIETHEMLYQVMQRHTFLPEAFTTDFQVHWGQHPLRPEFVESTYFLYKATGDSYYLDVGKRVIEALEKYARVSCGYAAVKDVRTNLKDDRMDSFVLAETFKYLYLLFADKSDIPLDLDQFVFTTEAHLLPLSLSKRRSSKAKMSQSLNNTVNSCESKTQINIDSNNKMPDKDATLNNDECSATEHHDDQSDRSRQDYRFRSSETSKVVVQNQGSSADSHRVRGQITDAECPNDGYVRNAEKIRLPLKNLVETTCPSRPIKKRRLLASQFDAQNTVHLDLISQMGVHVSVMSDGRIQLVHNSVHAASQHDAQEGLLFMQEMIQLAKQQTKQEQQMRSVEFESPTTGEVVIIPAGPAQFGPDLGDPSNRVTAQVVWTVPNKGCSVPVGKHCAELNGKIALLFRGECMFIEKTRNIQKCGAVGAIVFDTTADSSVKSVSVFAMSGDGGQNDPQIPVVFVFALDAEPLLFAIESSPNIKVSLGDAGTVLPANSGFLGTTTTEKSAGDLADKVSVVAQIDGVNVGQLEVQVEKLLQQIQQINNINDLLRGDGDTADGRVSSGEDALKQFPNVPLDIYREKIKHLLLSILSENDKESLGSPLNPLKLLNDLTSSLKGTGDFLSSLDYKLPFNGWLWRLSCCPDVPVTREGGKIVPITKETIISCKSSLNHLTSPRAFRHWIRARVCDQCVIKV